MSDDEPLEIPGFSGWTFYILDDEHRLIEEPDFMAWARWTFGENQDKRFIALDRIGDITVSTIFLGAQSKSFGSHHRLFETLLTSNAGRPGDIQRKYATWAEAEAGHRAIVNELRQKGD